MGCAYLIFPIGAVMPVLKMGEIEKVLADAAEKIRKEAYLAGWKDAMAAIAKAAADAAPTDVGNSLDLGIVQDPPTGHDPASGNMPAMGTTPYYAYQAVKKKPGMTGAEVIAAVHADGHNVADPQIRTALSRLDKRKLIVNRHKKWFPV